MYTPKRELQNGVRDIKKLEHQNTNTLQSTHQFVNNNYTLSVGRFRKIFSLRSKRDRSYLRIPTEKLDHLHDNIELSLATVDRSSSAVN